MPRSKYAFGAGVHSKRLTWALLLAIPSTLALVVIAKLPLELPMPVYLPNALEYARSGRLGNSFEPGGYPLLIGVAVRVSQPHSILGIEAVQGVLSVALVILSWRLLLRFGAGGCLALLGALLLGLHPDLLTINKIWDVPYSTFLLAAIMLLTLRAKERPNHAREVALGAIFALGCFDRPNFVALFPICCAALWSKPLRAKRGMYSRSISIGLVVASSFFLYACLSLSLYGHFRTPGNGPYNLFAGHNALSERSLRNNLNAESSIVPALQSYGLREPLARSPDLKPLYKVLSAKFALHHPASEVRLAAVKLLTLLRPDTRIHPLFSAVGAMKGSTCILIPTWTCVMVWVYWKHRSCLCDVDALVACTAILYVTPFLITNSDPRFRVPLEVLLSVHGIGLWVRVRDVYRRRPVAWDDRIPGRSGSERGRSASRAVMTE